MPTPSSSNFWQPVRPAQSAGTPCSLKFTDCFGERFRADLAGFVIGSCTTTIPLKLDFDSADTGYAAVLGPTGKGMSMPINRIEGQQ